MTLDEYFKRPDAMSIAQMRAAIGIKSDIQIRQWRHGYADRQPAPEYAMAIEIATDGLVMRWDTRTKDWHRIWPDLLDRSDHPVIAAAEEAA
jgi:DNA-binding transcriptional regulator YdaS (Cro superfamily)